MYLMVTQTSESYFVVPIILFPLIGNANNDCCVSAILRFILKRVSTISKFR